MKEPHHRMEPSHLKRDYWISTIEGMFATAAFGLFNPFLGVYAIALGASNSLVSTVSAIPFAVNTLLMVPAARLVRRARRKLPVVVASSVAFRLFYGVLAVLPFLPGDRALWLVVVLGIMQIPNVVLALAWTRMIAGVFPSTVRARVFGSRNAWTGATSIAATGAGGLLLDRVPFPYNYVWLMGTALVLGLTSSAIVSRTREEASPVQAGPPEGFRRQMREALRHSAMGRPLKAFLLSAFAFHFGLHFGLPLWPIYYVRDLGLTNALIGSFTVVMGATTVLGSWVAGRMAGRYGNQAVYFWSMAVMAVFPALLVLDSSPAYMLALHGVTGLFVGGFNLALFNLLIELTEPERQESAVASFHTLVGLTGVAAPFLATWTLGWLDTGQALAASTALRLVGCATLIAAGQAGMRLSPPVGRLRRRPAV